MAASETGVIEGYADDTVEEAVSLATTDSSLSASASSPESLGEPVSSSSPSSWAAEPSPLDMPPLEEAELLIPVGVALDDGEVLVPVDERVELELVELEDIVSEGKKVVAGGIALALRMAAASTGVKTKETS